jgi:hypothetical protein
VKELLFESHEGPKDLLFSETALAPVRQLNAQALELLISCSRHPAWIGSSWESALGRGFSRITSDERAGLARSPVALLEFGSSFSNLGPNSPENSTAEAPPAFLPLNAALPISQIMLALAWTLCRNDTAAASIVFGLPPTDVQKILSLDVRDLSAISERISAGLKPRWLNRPRIWRELLRQPDNTKAVPPAPTFFRILQRQLVDIRLATCATRSTRPIRP